MTSMLLFAGFGLGFLLLIFGFRGKRSGTAPHCRKCNFDLSGLVDLRTLNDAPDADFSTGPDRCPECGNRFDSPRAIARGQRKRSRLASVFGLLILLATLGLGVFFYIGSQTSLNSVKPTQLLVLEAAHLRGKARDAAAVELLKRHTKTPLSNGQLKALVAPSLDAQADAGVDWDQSPWLQFLDAAFAKGLVSKAQQTRYSTTAADSLDWNLPEHALSDQPWEYPPLSIYPVLQNEPRLVPSAPVALAATPLLCTIDHHAVELTDASIAPKMWQVGYQEYDIYISQRAGLGSNFVYNRQSVSGTKISPTPTKTFPPFNFPTGSHSLSAKWHIDAWVLPPYKPNTPRDYTQSLPSQPPVTSWTITLKHTVEAAPLDALLTMVTSDTPDIPTPQLQAGTSLSWPISKEDNTFHLAITGPLEYRPGAVRGISPEPMMVSGSIGQLDPKGKPLWIAGRVEIHAKGKVYPLRSNPYRDDDPRSTPVTISLDPNDQNIDHANIYGYIDPIDQAEGEQLYVDIVVVPDPSLAARQGATGLFWNEPLVCKHVQLGNPAPTGTGTEPGDADAVTPSSTDE